MPTCWSWRKTEASGACGAEFLPVGQCRLTGILPHFTLGPLLVRSPLGQAERTSNPAQSVPMTNDPPTILNPVPRQMLSSPLLALERLPGFMAPCLDGLRGALLVLAGLLLVVLIALLEYGLSPQ